MKVPVEETPLGKYMVKEFVYTPLNPSNMTTAKKMHLVPEETHAMHGNANYKPFNRAGNYYFYQDTPIDLLGNSYDIGSKVRVSTLQFERSLQMYSVKMTLGSYSPTAATPARIQFWDGEKWVTCSETLSAKASAAPVEFIIDPGSKSSKWRIYTTGNRPQIGSVRFFERL